MATNLEKQKNIHTILWVAPLWPIHS